jgi:DNA-binding MarR family transcriptional regulator
VSNTLQRTIHQKRPFASACQETALALLLTADRLRRHYEEVMAPYGLTFQQYNVLRIVRGAGAEGIATNEIGGRMIEQSPGLTRLLDKLEGKDLVRRERSPSDRRRVICTISESGAELLGRMEKPVRDAERGVLGDFDLEELAALRQLLERVRAGIAPNSAPTSAPNKESR